MKNREALGTRRLLKIWRPSKNVGRKMDFEAVHTWTRGEVSSCNCSEKTYRHVHCRCLRCKGKATTRSIELRHWSEARLLDAGATGTVEFNFHSGEGSDTNGPEEGMDIGEERTDLLEVLEMDENPDVESDLVEKDASNNCNTENVNPLKKLVVKAVLEALSIMDNSGASIKTFEDILAYGKAMLLESISSDIDVDILLREYFHSIHKFKTSRKYITNLGKYSHEKDFNSRVIWECHLYFIPNFENTMAIHIPIIIHSQL